ncbi:hypothetical protein BLS_005913 [Venturia inaequalis]|uniref:Glucose-methanol-choline oxidoreductase N-terminal domain-containing protein n=1 Tax=Venturia inaequalis TaxID=5025 RepID=A0A8H3YPY8_VENIN|nr:hypothetical protein BLS_005913 [Venturia inaequalis]KAE9968844.1 hypothetical protein EG327_010891 [Venturia inaequalis]
MFYSLPFAVLAGFVSHTFATPFPAADESFANAAFDYVIVGGGTGGLAVASRLSENPAVTVAVIEAGGHYETSNPLLSSTPAGDVFWVGTSPLDTNPLVDWNFQTTPQAGALGRKIHYARGYCLGGSSARNFMIYQRATKGSMDMWAKQIGDDSYSWENFLPHYQKSVNFTAPTKNSPRAANATVRYRAEAFPPRSGPLRVSYANYGGPFSSWIQGSLNEIGIPSVDDFNSGSLMGAQYCSSTIDPVYQTRESSETSFLAAAKGRKNLRVFSKTLAKKILFDARKQATGVEVVSSFVPFTISAKREVIVSAGAFQSPQLLMVSGIGPKATLNQFKIPVLSDLPAVGQGMEDHIFMGPTYRVNVDTLTKIANSIPSIVSSFLTEYFAKRIGPLTNPVCDFLGWEKVPKAMRSELSPAAIKDLASYPEDWPELEYLSAPGFIGNFSGLFASQPHDGYQYASILAALVAPLSKGSVTIKSADTSDLPLINPNWLTHPTDQEVAIAGYKRVRAAFASKFMAPVLTDKTEYYPGPAVKTNEQILNHIRKTLHTVWHAACTCRMGKKGDPNAVVDSKARVFGVKGVRVVDASAFAFLPPGHPQSTIYALAEKISTDILKDLAASRQ